MQPPISQRRFPIVPVLAGLLTVAAIVAATVWFFVVYISRSDYQAVADGYNALVATNKSLDITGDAMAEMPTPADITKTTQSADTFQAQLEAIGRLRAVQKDPELATAYASFRDRQSEYLRAERGAILLMHAAPECRDAADRGKKDACLSKLAAVSGANAPIMTEFARAFGEAVRNDNYLQMFDVSGAYAKNLKALQEKTEQSSNEFRDAVNRKLR